MKNTHWFHKHLHFPDSVMVYSVTESLLQNHFTHLGFQNTGLIQNASVSVENITPNTKKEEKNKISNWCRDGYDGELNDVRKIDATKWTEWQTYNIEVAQSTQNNNINAPVVKVFKTAASFGKARRKVEHKKVAIVLRLACDILKMKPIHSTVGRMQGQGLMSMNWIYFPSLPGKACAITIRYADGAKEKRHMAMTVSVGLRCIKPTITRLRLASHSLQRFALVMYFSLQRCHTTFVVASTTITLSWWSRAYTALTRTLYLFILVTAS